MVNSRFAVACVLALFVMLPAALVAATSKSYGDIVVVVENEPQGSATHGYAEIRVTVRNRSATSGHQVTLRLPHDSHRSNEMHLRSVTRTVEVGPGAAVQVALYVPAFPGVQGSGLTVTIDGRSEEEWIALNFPPSTFNSGRRYMGSGGYPRISSGGVTTGQEQPLILVGPTVPADFGTRANGGEMGAKPPEPVGVPGPVGGPAPGAAPVVALGPQSQFVKIDSPLAFWPTSWLGYSRYDGAILTSADLDALLPAARTALWQYVECGGALMMLGKVQLPESWVRSRDHLGLKVHEAGFGMTLVQESSKGADWREQWNFMRQTCLETGRPFQNILGVAEAHRQFPVVEDVGVPVRGLFVVMLAFVVVIGPVNLLVLGKMKRRLWMLWTVPVLSFTTCAAVFGTMALAEGWAGHLRTETLTVLDESSHRAATLGWTAFYSPLTPGDGLRFSTDTEVSLQAVPDYNYNTSGTECTADWTTDQHLARGWVSARVPAHFIVRKNEVRRERVTIRRGTDGKLTMVNGLGATIKKFWYRDEQGGSFRAEDVPAGEAAVLRNAEIPAGNVPVDLRLQQQAANGTKDKTIAPKAMFDELHEMVDVDPVDRAQPRSRAIKSLRSCYVGSWLNLIRQLPDYPREALRTSSYVAELDDTPFVEDGLRNAKTRQCRGVVIGVNKVPEKE